jgi:hypothetical protein
LQQEDLTSIIGKYAVMSTITVKEWAEEAQEENDETTARQRREHLRTLGAECFAEEERRSFLNWLPRRHFSHC